ncbi:MAG: hypothetical protein FWE03_03960 [Firmicutes bacterium]|nr:hypothetical protein [Bacillota bacterium]
MTESNIVEEKEKDNLQPKNRVGIRAMMLGAFLVVAFCMPMISFGWWYWENSITIFRVLYNGSHMTIFNVAAVFGLV